MACCVFIRPDPVGREGRGKRVEEKDGQRPCSSYVAAALCSAGQRQKALHAVRTPALANEGVDQRNVVILFLFLPSLSVRKIKKKTTSIAT